MIAAESRSMVPGVHVDLVPVEQLLGAAQRDPPVPGGDVRQSFAQPGHLLLQVSVELEQNLPGLQGVPSALQGLCQTVVPGGEELLVRCWVTRVQQHSACFIWYSAFVAVKWTSTSNEEQEIHTSIWNKLKTKNTISQRYTLYFPPYLRILAPPQLSNLLMMCATLIWISSARKFP